MPSNGLNMRQTVRAINEHLFHSSDAAYLQPAPQSHDHLRFDGCGIRVINARSRRGRIEVKSLTTGDWLPILAGDHVAVLHGGRCIAMYEAPEANHAA